MLLLPDGRKSPGQGGGEGRSSAPCHPPALGREDGEAAPLPLSTLSPRLHRQPARHTQLFQGISAQFKFPGTRKASCSLPSIKQAAGTPQSISRTPGGQLSKSPSWQLTPGAAHREAVPPAPRKPPAAPFSSSQAPVLRRAHRSSFAESQMLHPSQTSPGYNAHLEIPR